MYDGLIICGLEKTACGSTRAVRRRVGGTIRMSRRRAKPRARALRCRTQRQVRPRAARAAAACTPTDHGIEASGAASTRHTSSRQRLGAFLNLCVTSTMSAGSRLPRTRGGAPLVTVFILLASLISFTLAKNCIRGAGDRGRPAAAGEYAPTAAAPAVGAAERRSTAGAWSSDSRSGATKSIGVPLWCARVESPDTSRCGAERKDPKCDSR